MMDVEGDDGHGGGKGDQADGDPVIQSCELNSEFFFRMKNKNHIVYRIAPRTWNDLSAKCGKCRCVL